MDRKWQGDITLIFRVDVNMLSNWDIINLIFFTLTQPIEQPVRTNQIPRQIPEQVCQSR